MVNGDSGSNAGITQWHMGKGEDADKWRDTRPMNGGSAGRHVNQESK